MQVQFLHTLYIKGGPGEKDKLKQPGPVLISCKKLNKIHYSPQSNSKYVHTF